MEIKSITEPKKKREEEEAKCSCKNYKCNYDPFCKLHGALSTVKPFQFEELKNFYTK